MANISVTILNPFTGGRFSATNGDYTYSGEFRKDTTSAKVTYFNFTCNSQEGTVCSGDLREDGHVNYYGLPGTGGAVIVADVEDILSQL